MAVDREDFAAASFALRYTCRAIDELGNQCQEAAFQWGSFLAILNRPYGPSKLCIDGNEYHRRQRRRAKGRR